MAEQDPTVTDRRIPFQVRLPPDLVEAIDDRRRQVGERSRNRWIERALRWAVDQPVHTTTTTTKDQI